LPRRRPKSETKARNKQKAELEEKARQLEEKLHTDWAADRDPLTGEDQSDQPAPKPSRKHRRKPSRDDQQKE
jgi:hypothetical protein